jgi:hypothetical protein
MSDEFDELATHELLTVNQESILCGYSRITWVSTMLPQVGRASRAEALSKLSLDHVVGIFERLMDHLLQFK